MKLTDKEREKLYKKIGTGAIWAKRCDKCGKIIFGKGIRICSDCKEKSLKRLNLQRHIIREYYLEKYNWTCQKCKKSFLNSSFLHVHHIKFLSSRGNSNEENLTLLCQDCHKKIHDVK